MAKDIRVIYVPIKRTFWQWCRWNLKGRPRFKFPGKEVSCKEMADRINSMPGGSLWPGGCDG